MTEPSSRRRPAVVVGLVVLATMAMAVAAAVVNAVSAEERSQPSFEEQEDLIAGDDDPAPGKGAAAAQTEPIEETGTRVDLGLGLYVDLPPGWDLVGQENGLTRLYADGADFWITNYAIDPSLTASDLLTYYYENTVLTALTDVQLGEIQPFNELPEGVSDLVGAGYTAVWASPSGGNSPLDGHLYSMIAGTVAGLVVDITEAPGTYEDHVDDYDVMFGSLFESVAAVV